MGISNPPDLIKHNSANAVIHIHKGGDALEKRKKSRHEKIQIVKTHSTRAISANSLGDHSLGSSNLLGAKKKIYNQRVLDVVGGSSSS